jgi:hypothetical protein
MYPRDYFETYWRPEIREEVFVAMPFHDEFTSIWSNAIQPAIDDDIPGPIKARRVDATLLSGSIITDILDGIAHSRLVLADISVATTGRWAGQRNGNVMYEVGLAHAVRQSTEILLIRSDNEPINFDIAHINIHSYDPQDIDATRSKLARLANDLLKQIEQEKSLMVTKAVDGLDADCIFYIREYAIRGAFVGPDPKTMGEQLVSITNKAALARLQHLGIIKCDLQPNHPMPIYYVTNFGKAVAKRIVQ